MGLIFAIVIGSAYYKLANEYKKSKWLYAILGIILFNVSFYAYYFLAAIFIDSDTLENSSSDFLYFFGVIFPYIFGLIVVVAFYIRFDNKWNKIQGNRETKN
jgi:hypothetical protein